jgi:hypothetical protein
MSPVTLYCVYISPSEELIREHARLSGFPANRISKSPTSSIPPRPNKPGCVPNRNGAEFMSTPIDLVALKNRQMAAWASGDYAVIGTTLQIVGEQLAEACDLLCDERVLDVAAGSGNATLAAARRGLHRPLDGLCRRIA